MNNRTLARTAVVSLILLLPMCAPPVYHHRETGWSLLAAGQREDARWGLHSYLLFGRQPSPELQNKYLEVIQQLLYSAPTAEALVRSGLPRSAINNTYIPVVSYSSVSRPPRDQARWI